LTEFWAVSLSQNGLDSSLTEILAVSKTAKAGIVNVSASPSLTEFGAVSQNQNGEYFGLSAAVLNISPQPKPTEGAVSAAPSGFPRFFNLDRDLGGL